MRVKLRTLLIAWIVILAILLWAFIDSLSASITRPVIRNSELKWSSYHAYHCILYWNGDAVTFSNSRVRQTLKACALNKRWAKRKVKRWMKYSPKKRVRKIFDYITDSYEYDRDYVWLEQARGHGKANCSAYADMFYALCKAARIPVRYVMGWAGGGWHCWNRVKIKKKWYWVDCTWGRWISKKLWSDHGRIIEEW